MKVVISKRACRQIERIQSWWVERRPSARALFLEELTAAEQQLRRTPELGSIYAEGKTGVVRRVLLPKTHHHLYYRYRADRNELTVVSVWGAPKGRGPKL